MRPGCRCRWPTLPDHVRHATLAAEDTRFYEHAGVDPRASSGPCSAPCGGGSGRQHHHPAGGQDQLHRRRADVARKLREVLYAAPWRRTTPRTSSWSGTSTRSTSATAPTGSMPPPSRSSASPPPSPRRRPPSSPASCGPPDLDPRERPDRVRARRDQVLHTMADEGWLTGHRLDGGPGRAGGARPAAAAGRAPGPALRRVREAGGQPARDLGPTPRCAAPRCSPPGRR